MTTESPPPPTTAPIEPSHRRSYTVVGAGAVGLLYGARLAAAGHPVRWLLRSDAETVLAEGIEVRTPTEVLRIDPGDLDAASDPRELEPSDVVLVATKTTANHLLAELVTSVAGVGTVVALFQNGLGAEDRLRSECPELGPILGGLCFVCAHRTGPGRCDHLDYGAVTLAPHDETGSDAATAVGADLADSGVEVTVLPDLAMARWRKLVWNVPFNGLTVVLDATTDEILADPAGRRIVTALMDEVIAASQAVGHPVPTGFRDEMLAITDAMRPYAPSMKLDHDAGRPLELAAIYDEPIRQARAAGAPMHRVEELADQVRFLSARTA